MRRFEHVGDEYNGHDSDWSRWRLHVQVIITRKNINKYTIQVKIKKIPNKVLKVGIALRLEQDVKFEGGLRRL